MTMKANINQLTAKQRRALYDEVNRQTAKNVQSLSQNLQAMVLWSSMSNSDTERKGC